MLTAAPLSAESPGNLIQNIDLKMEIICKMLSIVAINDKAEYTIRRIWNIMEYQDLDTSFYIIYYHM